MLAFFLLSDAKQSPQITLTRNKGMKFKTLLSSICLLTFSQVATAGVIDSDSTLLDDAGATQIETWLGMGDLDWDSIWYGEAGAMADSWHEAVDGVGATVSIYSLSHQGNDFLVGGYTDLNWGNSGFVQGNNNSFIFNLNTNEMFESLSGYYEIYANSARFASFGEGLDLYGGQYALGDGYGYSYDYSYGKDGNLTNGINGGQLLGVPYNGGNLEINALETFTFAAAAPSTPANAVPEPSSLAILAAGLLGLIRFRSKKA